MAQAAQPQKRIHLYAGAGSRDYAMMAGANAKAKRNPDGSQGDPGVGDNGAYSSDGSGGAAFPTAPEAFPDQDGG